MPHELQLTRMLWHFAMARRAALREQPRDLGASAIEWAIISAILVTAAVLIGGAIWRVVDAKSTVMEDCADVAVGSEGC